MHLVHSRTKAQRQTGCYSKQDGFIREEGGLTDLWKSLTTHPRLSHPVRLVLDAWCLRLSNRSCSPSDDTLWQLVRQGAQHPADRPSLWSGHTGTAHRKANRPPAGSYPWRNLCGESCGDAGKNISVIKERRGRYVLRMPGLHGLYMCVCVCVGGGVLILHILYFSFRTN